MYVCEGVVLDAAASAGSIPGHLAVTFHCQSSKANTAHHMAKDMSIYMFLLALCLLTKSPGFKQGVYCDDLV